MVVRKSSHSSWTRNRSRQGMLRIVAATAMNGVIVMIVVILAITSIMATYDSYECCGDHVNGYSGDYDSYLKVHGYSEVGLQVP